MKHKHSPRLHHAGSKLVSLDGAPADSRFVQVPGGWRPRVFTTLPESADGAEGNGQNLTTAPWQLETVRLPKNSSQISLNTASSRTWASTSQFSNGTQDWSRQKRSRRRASKATYAYRSWPPKLIDGKSPEAKVGLAEAGEDGFESNDSLGEPNSFMGGGRRNSSDSFGQLETSSFRSGGARRHSRGSVGRQEGWPFGRRISGAAQTTFQGRRASLGSDGGLTFDTPDPVDQRGLPDAVESAKAAQEQALADGCSQSERRTRRVLAYTEALITSPDMKQREEERADVRSLSFLESDEDAAELETCQLNQEHELAKLFAEHDGGLTGFISRHDLRPMLRRLGRALSAEDVCHMLETLPGWEEMDGEIDFKELLAILDTRRHAERVYLQGAFRDKFKGIGDSGIKPELRDLAKIFEGISIHITAELVRRTAADMELDIFGNFVAISRETQFFILAARCRNLEKQRANERAGFSLNQVQRFQELFESTIAQRRPGAKLKEFIDIIARLGITVNYLAEKDDLEQAFYSGQDKDTELPILECLHAARRFVDKKELDERDRDTDAAKSAGIPDFELIQFRQFYNQLMDEETPGVFSYQALAKAVRIMGATLSMETNAELDSRFRHYVSKATHDDEEVDHLEFSDFINLVSDLFSENFGGIKSGFDAEGDEVAVAFLQQSETSKAGRRGRRPTAAAIPHDARLGWGSKHLNPSKFSTK